MLSGVNASATVGGSLTGAAVVSPPVVVSGAAGPVVSPVLVPGSLLDVSPVSGSSAAFDVGKIAAAGVARQRFGGAAVRQAQPTEGWRVLGAGGGPEGEDEGAKMRVGSSGPPPEFPPVDGLVVPPCAPLAASVRGMPSGRSPARATAGDTALAIAPNAAYRAAASNA